MAISAAAFAIVPVNSVWIEVIPLSNGEAWAASGTNEQHGQDSHATHNTFPLHWAEVKKRHGFAHRIWLQFGVVELAVVKRTGLLELKLYLLELSLSRTSSVQNRTEIVSGPFYVGSRQSKSPGIPHP